MRFASPAVLQLRDACGNLTEEGNEHLSASLTPSRSPPIVQSNGSSPPAARNDGLGLPAPSCGLVHLGGGLVRLTLRSERAAAYALRLSLRGDAIGGVMERACEVVAAPAHPKACRLDCATPDRLFSHGDTITLRISAYDAFGNRRGRATNY
eukprot:6177633-Pleurochrysis_carterae.AAC.2